MLLSNWSQLLSQLPRALLPPGVLLLPVPVPRQREESFQHILRAAVGPGVTHSADADGKVAVRADITHCPCIVPNKQLIHVKPPVLIFPRGCSSRGTGGIHARTNPLGTLSSRVVKMALAALSVPGLTQLILHVLPAPLSLAHLEPEARQAVGRDRGWNSMECWAFSRVLGLLICEGWC